MACAKKNRPEAVLLTQIQKKTVKKADRPAKDRVALFSLFIHLPTNGINDCPGQAPEQDEYNTKAEAAQGDLLKKQ
ncbi:MAG: hypothetical protein LBB77_00470 [Treponema sp.]|nr:hypothetical protein [Treponema sp.]